jgi:hypothetical protein
VTGREEGVVRPEKDPSHGGQHPDEVLHVADEVPVVDAEMLAPRQCGNVRRQVRNLQCRDVEKHRDDPYSLTEGFGKFPPDPVTCLAATTEFRRCP